MNTNKVEINLSNNQKIYNEIDSTANCILVIKDGQLTKIAPPQTGFGEYTVIWKDGKVLDVIKSERVRI